MSDLRKTTAVVLAGGLGTRLRAAVADRPKVLASVAGRPFLAFLLDQLRDAGVRDAVICLGYLGEQIRERFGEEHRGMHVEYTQEKTPLGTGGALRSTVDMAHSDPVIAMNGDSYCEADLAALFERHMACRAEATLLLTNVPNARRYGRVALDRQNAIVAFEEKGGSDAPGCINAGIYVLSRRFLEAIPSPGASSIERDVFPEWIGRGLFGLPEGKRFLDIGTPASYAAAERFFNSMKDTMHA